MFPAQIANHSQVEEENDAKIKVLDAKIKDTEENLGESEVREALLAKANFYHDIGDKENALAAYKLTTTKTVAIGLKLDIVFSVLRIGFCFGDNDLIHRYLEIAEGYSYFFLLQKNAN